MEDKLLNIGLRVQKEDVHQFIPVKEVSEITDGIWMTGDVPKSKGFKTTSNKYKTGLRDQLKTDEFIDDQSLFFETEKGFILLLGSSHVGIINIVEYIKKVTGDQRIYAIIGASILLMPINPELTGGSRVLF